jgi:adenine/guanine phosphoribosyltransferase-like PRPP-binding protein
VRGEGNKRIVTVKEGDAAGRHVFIIDDLVQTGTAATLQHMR